MRFVTQSMRGWAVFSGYCYIVVQLDKLSREEGREVGREGWR